MYMYLDESGNTGLHIFDENQRHFYLLTTLSKWNINRLFSTSHSKALSLLNCEELHGNELGHHGIEKVTHVLGRVIKRSGSRFILCKAEKLFFAAALLFDSIFDPDQNPAASWEVYMDNGLRDELFHLFLQSMPYEILNDFWTQCVRPNNAERKMAAFVTLCRSILNDILPRLTNQDPRAEFMQLVLSNLNPEICDIEICSQGLDTARGFSPNATSFGTLLTEACVLAKRMDRHIIESNHDVQNEFMTHLANVIEIGQNFPENPREEVLLPVDGLDLSPLSNTEYSMRESSQCFGIQLTDVVLWSLKQHHERNRQNRLAKFVNKRLVVSNFGFGQYGLSAPEPLR